MAPTEPSNGHPGTKYEVTSTDPGIRITSITTNHFGTITVSYTKRVK